MLPLETLAIMGLVNMEFASQINRQGQVALLTETVQLDNGAQLINANLMSLQEVPVLLLQICIYMLLNVDTKPIALTQHVLYLIQSKQEWIQRSPQQVNDHSQADSANQDLQMQQANQLIIV